VRFGYSCGGYFTFSQISLLAAVSMQTAPSAHTHLFNAIILYGFNSSCVAQFVVMLAVHAGLPRISAGGGLQSVGLSSSFLP